MLTQSSIENVLGPVSNFELIKDHDSLPQSGLPIGEFRAYHMLKNIYAGKFGVLVFECKNEYRVSIIAHQVMRMRIEYFGAPDLNDLLKRVKDIFDEYNKTKKNLVKKGLPVQDIAFW